MTNIIHKIDRDVPIPTVTCHLIPKTRGPISTTVAALRVSESFFITIDNDAKLSAIKLRSGVNVATRKLRDRKYIIRSVIEDSKKGARCWRVA